MTGARRPVEDILSMILRCLLLFRGAAYGGKGVLTSLVLSGGQGTVRVGEIEISASS